MRLIHRHLFRVRSDSRQPAIDRRRECRYPAKVPQIQIGWEGDGAMIELSVRLIDVSSSGCRAEVDRFPHPHPGEPVWMRNPVAQDEWLEGSLVSAGPAGKKRTVLRLRFVSPLPYATFKYLVYGPEKQPAESAPRPWHERDELWK